jgi:hypothetical protein
VRMQLRHQPAGHDERRRFVFDQIRHDLHDGAMSCTQITSPTIKRKQEAIWKSAKLPDEALQVLQARSPACTPAKPERSPAQK